MPTIHQHQLDNGLWLVAEPMPAVQSLAASWLAPAGVIAQPNQQQGVAALLAEMIFRGAGDLDAKAHSDALDNLGVQRSSHVGTTHLHLGATMLADNLTHALPLLADMLRRPTLDQSALEPSRDLAIQSLDALEDEPQQKVFDQLTERHYDPPFNRSPLGRREHLQNLTRDHVRQYARTTFVPDGTILAFAGRIDWDDLKTQITDAFADWTGQAPPSPTPEPPQRGYHHITAQTAQAHIGLAYDALPQPDPNSILQRAATAVLSGGMSCRLFTEVREKRALCYAVYASYAAQKNHGAVLGYAGTTVPRAQETLDVLAAELVRLSDGIEQDEFQRAIVGMKSRLVMQGESTGARARSIAAEQYIYGRPRTLDDWAAEVDAITLDRLNDFIKATPPGPMTVVTIGPETLKCPDAAIPAAV